MAKHNRASFIHAKLSPTQSRILGSYALVSMHGWFLAKLALPSESGAIELLVGLAALTGLIASITFFVGSYGVIANAPDSMLDEREQVVRYRAYFSAFQYIVVMTIAGGMIPEFLAKVFNFELSVAVMKNFMLLMFATALILPGFIIAWSDRELAE